MEIQNDEQVDEILREASSLLSSKLHHFVALPSDPLVPLTMAQLDALFPLNNRPLFIAELVELSPIEKATFV